MVKEFNVLLTPTTVYEVQTEDGQPLGRFVAEDAWHGMQCLKRDDGKILIVVAENQLVTGISSILNSREPRLAPVMSASPELVPTRNDPPELPQLSGEEADRIRGLMLTQPVSPGRDFAQEDRDEKLMEKLNAIIGK